jgi:hypothetical protein
MAGNSLCVNISHATRERVEPFEHFRPAPSTTEEMRVPPAKTIVLFYPPEFGHRAHLGTREFAAERKSAGGCEAITPQEGPRIELCVRLRLFVEISLSLLVLSIMAFANSCVSAERGIASRDSLKAGA